MPGYAIARPVELRACAACGATRAVATRHSAVVCSNCWDQFESWKQSEWLSDALHTIAPDVIFNTWLAHKLTLSIKRLKAHGVSTRCEALVHDRQCGAMAITKRDGRPVCGKHSDRGYRTATHVSFIGEETADSVGRLVVALAEFARADAKFRALLLREMNVN
jgi:hypothetical protein